MDGPRLLLEFVEVGSRDRNMSCSAPAAEKCLGYIYLGPAGVADWADEAGRIVEALHRLVLCRAKSPHVTTTTKVMRTGVMKFLSHRVRGAGKWGSVFIGMAAGIPFRRRGHEWVPWPLAIFPSGSLGINYRVSESGMAISGDLDHHCALPAEVDVGNFHPVSLGVQKVSACTYLPHEDAT